ncbi:hypothetical protein [Absidia glauca]|uniref:PX domain-containing protein n=1 Tax=Absidia glauca TaxID=4829 RepID=A0A168MG06_ABSGL|nr:hypothetical protein [Absidia glauca]
MPIALLPSQSSLSTSTTMHHHNNKSSLASSGIKLAPLIRQATVVSYERRQGKMWFVIHVDPQQYHYDDCSMPKQRHPYTITRRYDDCVHFCQRLYDAFPCLSSTGETQRTIHQQQHQIYRYHLPKLKSQGLLNKKQPNGQRRAELDRFVQALFRLPAAISQTLIVLEFFGVQKNDMAQQVLRDQENMFRQQQALLDHQPVFMDDDQPISPKWTSKFKPFRSRSSSSSLTSFLPSWSHHHHQQQHIMPPRKNSDDLLLPDLTSSNSSTTSSISTFVSSSTPRSSTTGPSISSSFSLLDQAPSGVRKMKLKVIYDVDNIVIIQIPRSTNLAALRTRLHDKFSTMLDPSLKPLADQFVLLYNGSSDHQPLTLISSEQHWTKAMKTWDGLEKVTLRCIH